MPDYRAYLVGADGRFFNFVEIVCDDDAKAIERAEQAVDGHDVELWSGARLVKLLKHTSDEVRALDRQLEQSRHMSKSIIDSVASARFDQLTNDLTRERADQQKRDDEKK
jgi:hypothetical protein